MKRNPFWDAQAKQYLASAGAAGGAVPNALSRLAAPGGGLPRAPVPITAIARPIQPAGPVAPMGAGAALPAPAPMAGTPMPRMSPVRPVNPMPPQPAPVAGTVGGTPDWQKGFPGPRVKSASGFPSMGGVGFPGGGGRAAAPARPVANQGTPFQYRVSRGVR